MKEEKRIWINKIEALESSMVRYFRTGMLLNRICINYMKLFSVAAIVFFVMVFFELCHGQMELAKSLGKNNVFFAFVVSSIVIPIFLDTGIAHALIGKSLRLGAEVMYLKKFGWNARPFHS